MASFRAATVFAFQLYAPCLGHGEEMSHGCEREHGLQAVAHGFTTLLQLFLPHQPRLALSSTTRRSTQLAAMHDSYNI